MSQIACTMRRMLSTMLPGSKPSACRITPTSTQSRMSRKATASGRPPRKRLIPFERLYPRRSLMMPCSRHRLSRTPRRCSPGERTYRRRAFGAQHRLHGLQPVGLARRLVPAQAADAREAHRDAGLVPRRALQALEGDFHHQPLVGLMHHFAHRSEAVDRVAPHVAVDLEKLFVGEAEIGLADRHQLVAVLAGRPEAERVVRIE